MAQELSCSFCVRTEAETSRLIAGPGVYICDDCVRLCQEILQDQPDHSPGSHGAQVLPWGSMSDAEMLYRLPRMRAVADQAEDGLQQWVTELRRRSVTWERIGTGLGMTRQSAWTRFHREVVS